MNKLLLGAGALAAVSGAGMTLASRMHLTRRARHEVGKRTHREPSVPHNHTDTVHEHEHTHVTHNRREGADGVMGEWEHLTATHLHDHNHPAVSHAHAAHEDAEHEHLGEAHIHDHDHPTRS